MKVDGTRRKTIENVSEVLSTNRFANGYGLVIFGFAGDKAHRIVPGDKSAPLDSIERLVILTGGHHNQLGVVSVDLDKLQKANVLMEIDNGLVKVRAQDTGRVSPELAWNQLIEKQLVKAEGTVGLDHRYACTAVLWDKKWNRAIICAGGTGSDFVAEIWQQGKLENQARTPLSNLEDMPDITGSNFIQSGRDGQVTFSDVPCVWEHDSRPTVTCAQKPSLAPEID
jgi:hypothetical protein